MAPKKIATRSIEPTQANNYFKRAAELYEMAIHAHDLKNWNAAGINAVLAAIALGDALLILMKGIRSKSPNHMNQVELFRRELNHLPDIDKAVSHLRFLVSRKSGAEYESALLTQKDAAAMIQHLDRLNQWVNKHRT